MSNWSFRKICPCTSWGLSSTSRWICTSSYLPVLWFWLWYCSTVNLSLADFVAMPKRGAHLTQEGVFFHFFALFLSSSLLGSAPKPKRIEKQNRNPVLNVPLLLSYWLFLVGMSRMSILPLELLFSLVFLICCSEIDPNWNFLNILKIIIIIIEKPNTRKPTNNQQQKRERKRRTGKKNIFILNCAAFMELVKIPDSRFCGGASTLIF